jgi:hypothetical protein
MFFKHYACFPLFIFVVKSKAAVAAWPDSVWGMKYHEWHSQCRTHLISENGKLKQGNYIFLALCLPPLFIFLVSIGTAFTASPASLWELIYQTWHGWCVRI